jgi:hypothetical protein
MGGRRQTAGAAVRSDYVATLFPDFEGCSGVGKRDEDGFVERLISHAADGAPHEGVLVGLPDAM